MDTGATNCSHTDDPHNIGMERDMDCEPDEVDTPNNCLRENNNAVTDMSDTDDV